MAEGGGPACREGQQPPAQQVIQQQLHMNWSHFKPEFSGKPDEDVEAHLLRTNEWMTTHDFPEAVNKQVVVKLHDQLIVIWDYLIEFICCIFKYI